MVSLASIRGSEEAKCWSGAVAGVDDAKLFFERIELDTVLGAPCMN